MQIIMKMDISTGCPMFGGHDAIPAGFRITSPILAIPAGFRITSPILAILPGFRNVSPFFSYDA